MNISIDPSGTGTTAIYHSGITYTLNKLEWIDHYNYIKMFIKDNNINTIYLETLKMIYSTTNHSLSLIKLLGALEILFNDKNIKVINITSDQTKRCAKWFKDIKYIEWAFENQHKLRKEIREKYEFCKKTEVTYQYMRGWFYKNKKISEHERDAILIYWIGKEKK